MAEIGKFEKINTTWQTPITRPVERGGQRDQSFNKKKQKEHPGKNSRSEKEEGPGKNIDEYA